MAQLLGSVVATITAALLLCLVLFGGCKRERSQLEHPRDMKESDQANASVTTSEYSVTLGHVLIPADCFSRCHIVVDALHGDIECPTAAPISVFSGFVGTIGPNVQPGSDGYESTEPIPFGLIHMGTSTTQNGQRRNSVNLIVHEPGGPAIVVTQFNSDDMSHEARQLLLRLARSFQRDDARKDRGCTAEG
jgi:hypothetical protein